MSWSGFRAVHLTAVPCCFLKTVIYASHVTEEKKQGLNPELQARIPCFKVLSFGAL